MHRSGPWCKKNAAPHHLPCNERIGIVSELAPQGPECWAFTPSKPAQPASGIPIGPSLIKSTRRSFQLVVLPENK